MIKFILAALLIGTAPHSATSLNYQPVVIGDVVFPTAEALEIPAPVPKMDPTRMTRAEIRTRIDEYAIPLHVSTSSMLRTVLCEAAQNANGTFDATGQSRYIDPYTGIQEDSWGLAQIHLPSHPSISKKEAQDPDTAISFMAEQFAIGNAWMWTCWRDIHSL